MALLMLMRAIQAQATEERLGGWIFPVYVDKVEEAGQVLLKILSTRELPAQTPRDHEIASQC